MDDVANQLTATDFASNVVYSHKANDLERAMANVFVGMVHEHLLDDLNALFDYGVPWSGSRTVVERFSKAGGLAVLRRDDDGLSDKLMAIILANWQAMASERGLAFLQFVLDMLYPKQNVIVRLWHPKRYASSYPDYVSEEKGAGKFLTSRIRIKLAPSVNIAELSELAPTLTRLVPWHIVPEIAVGFETQTSQLGMALSDKGIMWGISRLFRLIENVCG